MKSLTEMIGELQRLINTPDLNEWENEFVKSIVKQKQNTRALSQKQVDRLDQLYRKHFA
jgi:hypothetical protein